MKNIVLTIALIFSANAFAAEYVTVEVCGYGENSNVNECKMVTYKQRRPNLPSEEYQFQKTDEGTSSENGHVPAWLAKLNAKLIAMGFKPVEQSSDDTGGAQ